MKKQIKQIICSVLFTSMMFAATPVHAAWHNDLFSSLSDTFENFVQNRVRNNIESAVDEGVLIEKGYRTGSGKRFHLYINPTGGLRLKISDGTNTFAINSARNISDGQTYHVIATIDRSGNGILYINGVMDSPAVDVTGIGDIDERSSSLVFGAQAQLQTNNLFTGTMTLVRIWNRVLGQEEILHLVSGAPVSNESHGANNTNLVANGDAFTGATGSTPPTSWSDSGAGTATYIIRNNTGVANMDADTLEFASSGGEKILKQAILTPGKRYRLSFAYRNYDGSAASYVYMGSSANQAILTHTTMIGDGILFSQEFLADGSDMGFVTADGGAIQMDDVQVIPIGCVAQYEPDGIGSTIWYDKSGNGLHGTVNGATAMNLPIAYVNDAGRHMVEGEPGDRCILRSVKLRLQPGTTAGTNINVKHQNPSTDGFNPPTITDATDLTKSGTSGSFSLNSDGKTLTINLAEDVVGLLAAGLQFHDLNNGSMTEMYLPNVYRTGKDIKISLVQRAQQSAVDLTSVLQTNDLVDVLISFITSS